MGELLLDEVGCTGNGGKWSVERRFRVTEVFLAVLWVWISLYLLEWSFHVRILEGGGGEEGRTMRG
jgi:hypothetical protein